MTRLQQTLTVLSLVAAFYIGHGLHTSEPISMPSLTAPVYAGDVASAAENTEMVFTSSPDGKKLYLWRYQGTRKPRFLGEAEAVLYE